MKKAFFSLVGSIAFWATPVITNFHLFFALMTTGSASALIPSTKNTKEKNPTNKQ